MAISPNRFGLILRYAFTALLLGLGSARAEYWAVDPAFDPVLEGDTVISGVVLSQPSPGGKVLISTSYSIVNGAFLENAWLTRLNSDGTVDPAFTPAETSGQPLAAYSDGRVLYGILPASGFANLTIKRMLQEGSVDPAFSPILVNTNFVSAVLASDGSIFLTGSFTTVGGSPLRGLARLNPDGTLATDFQSPFTSGSPSVNCITRTPDGHLYIAGSLGLGAGLNAIARLNPDGSVDPTFNTGGITFPGTVVRSYLQPDGTLVVADSAGTLRRFSSTGTLDSVFAPIFPGVPRSFGAAQSDGKAYYLTSQNGGTVTQLRRMNSDFTDDGSFTAISTPYGSTYDVGLPVLGDSGELFLGALTQVRKSARLELSRVSPAGVIDPSFNPRFSRPMVPDALVRQPDGRELIAGRFDHVGNVPVAGVYSILRLLDDGSLDSSFSAPLIAGSSVNRLALQPDGKILAFGNFPLGNGNSVQVRRFGPDGVLDTGFPEIGTFPTALAVDATGRFYAVVSGTGLVRYLANGQLDPGFLAPIVAGSARFVTPSPDGKVLVSRFVSGTSYSLMRLLSNGTQDPGFSPINVGQLISTVGFPDGSALVCSLQTVISGKQLLLRRLPASESDFSSDFIYYSHPWTNTIADPDIQMSVAGVVLDLLRQASAGQTASAWADFSNNIMRTTFECRTDGQLMRADRPDGFGSYLQRYLRTDSGAPSFDPGPFSISINPTSLNLRPLNATPALSVTVGGLGPFHYQWLKDGVLLPGIADSATVFLPALQAADAGAYSVNVSNSYATVPSPSVNLTVDTAHAGAKIVGYPASGTAYVGGSTTFTVIATGNPAPTYQWYKGTTAISGTNTTSLTLNNIQLGDAGNYHVVASNNVTNAAGSFGFSVDSGGATLTVLNGLAMAHDFNGDHTSDLVWQNTTTGDRYVWFMNGGAVSGGASLGSLSTDWVIASTADFNGDGKPDILWQNTITGEKYVWFISGMASIGGGSLGSLGPEWDIAAAADFNGDGKPDLLWQNTNTGLRYIWFMDGITATGGVSLGVVGTEWDIASAADFNGDGKPDILWQNRATGDRYIWYMNGVATAGGVSLGNVSIDWDIAGTGDFNGDGKTDILWQNTSTGLRYIWFMDGAASIGGVSLGIVGLEWKLAD